MPNSVIAAFSFVRLIKPVWSAVFTKSLEQERQQLPLLLPICFAAGIASWFALPLREYWVAVIFIAIAIGLLSFSIGEYFPNHARPMRWMAACALMIAAGIIIIWTKSLLIGAQPLDKPWVGQMRGQIISIDNQPAKARIRLYIAPDEGQNLPQKIRLNVDMRKATEFPSALRTGQIISAKVRLMPPNAPVIPGAYDFAQRAWFEGLGATGSLLDIPKILQDNGANSNIEQLRSQIAQHVQSQLPGSQGGIAATLATGDRGGLSDKDAEAMRRSGLAHLLALSGLHVSAVIGAVFLIVVKLLALSPALALRFRLPVMAALIGAVAGIAYTIFTGAEIPTVRACVAALLILSALILGRDPVSLRLVGFAAFVVLLIWPEALIGPSFQMSFAAVMAIVALYDTDHMRGLSLKRDEGDFALLPRIGRFVLMLFLTGLVIEISLIPIALYHFNKAGLYGALANLIAIPLTTFIIMPLEALALLADVFDLGTPIWWLCGKALSLLLDLAHFVSSTPGSNILLPTMPGYAFLAFVAGGLLLFCLCSPLRFLAIIPIGFAAASYIITPTPDIIIADDGRQFAVKKKDGHFLLLKPQSDSFATQMIREEAGFGDDSTDLKQWAQSQCSPDFCSFTVSKAERDWVIMASISNNYVPLRNLSAACARSDIVIAPRRLPYICRPRWQKIDGRYLGENGGVSIYLNAAKIVTARVKTDHGWRR